MRSLPPFLILPCSRSETPYDTAGHSPGAVQWRVLCFLNSRLGMFALKIADGMNPNSGHAANPALLKIHN